MRDPKKYTVIDEVRIDYITLTAEDLGHVSLHGKIIKSHEIELDL